MYREGIALLIKYGVYCLLTVLFTDHNSSKQLSLTLKMKECFALLGRVFNLTFITFMIRQQRIQNSSKSQLIASYIGLLNVDFIHTLRTHEELITSHNFIIISPMIHVVPC